MSPAPPQHRNGSARDAAEARVKVVSEEVAEADRGAAATDDEAARLGAIEAAAVAVRDGRIEWVGVADGLPRAYADWPRSPAPGPLVTPALVDCHTHLVYGGSRAAEFEQRLSGVSYEQIARAGGGILSTVRATRAASREELVRSAAARSAHLLREGVGTVEIKSGYGLRIDSELEMLRAARELGELLPGLRVRTTLLAAHAVPPEHRDRPERYVDEICEEILPAAVDEGLADQADVFCENIAFDLEQSERVLRAAADLGLSLRMHAEQLSASGAAELAARLGARSADHLEYLGPAGVEAMRRSGSVAVLLPGALYTLRETRRPPVESLRRAGVEIAVATDWNPGSSPLGSLLLAANMACTLLGTLPDEALVGVTRAGARVLGLEDEVGTIEVGRRAELLSWPLEDPVELCYRIGGQPTPHRLVGDRWIDCGELAAEAVRWS